MIVRVEWVRREHKWSASRIKFELALDGTAISRRTVSRILFQLGLNRRRFIDPSGESNREPQLIVTERPGHMINIDGKMVGRIPAGGGWRVHGRDSPQARAVERAKKRGTRSGYVYLHTAIDGHTRLAYTESLDNEKGTTAAEFLERARGWFAAHGITMIERIITDNGACYRSKVFAEAVLPARHQRITPYRPRHNGKVERYNRVLTEEFLYARFWRSEQERADGLVLWNLPLQLSPTPQRTRRKAARIRNLDASRGCGRRRSALVGTVGSVIVVVQIPGLQRLFALVF